MNTNPSPRTTTRQVIADAVIRATGPVAGRALPAPRIAHSSRQ